MSELIIGSGQSYILYLFLSTHIFHPNWSEADGGHLKFGSALVFLPQGSFSWPGSHLACPVKISFCMQKITLPPLDVGQMLYCPPILESSFKWPWQRVNTFLTTTTKSSGYMFTRHCYNYSMLYKITWQLYFTNHATHTAKVVPCQTTRNSWKKTKKRPGFGCTSCTFVHNNKGERRRPALHFWTDSRLQMV